ncbi:HAMP domain-containing histidine kinase [Erysipelotrichaceae bacterium OttesenSCG-928-M19]|nr:HAMP domain-containing histidine kinase [Erysipelotrichaceae bacterium OttesenSCG-928-M19]
MYLLMKVNFTVLIIINIIVIIFIVLLARYLTNKRIIRLQHYNKEKNRTNLLNSLTMLINDIKQPILIIFSDEKMIYNQALEQLYDVASLRNMLLDDNYLTMFMTSKQNEKHLETTINEKPYQVILKIFSNDYFSGTIVQYIDVSLLKEIKVQQDNFIDDIKHELKTPITAIVGLSDLLSKDKVNSLEDQKRVIKTIKSETKRLDSLINNLTSSIDISLNLEIIRMDDVFEELKAIYDHKDLHLTLTFSNYLEEEFISDKEIIKQIIINLINNALKFTEKGYITVSSFIENDNIKIAIVDTGVGIAPEELDSIFERFYRIDKSRNRDTGGYGLGLSIVKSLLKKVDGTIEVASTTNQGSTFTITLPFKKDFN